MRNGPEYDIKPGYLKGALRYLLVWGGWVLSAVGLVVLAYLYRC